MNLESHYFLCMRSFCVVFKATIDVSIRYTDENTNFCSISGIQYARSQPADSRTDKHPTAAPSYVSIFMKVKQTMTLQAMARWQQCVLVWTCAKCEQNFNCTYCNRTSSVKLLCTPLKRHVRKMYFLHLISCIQWTLLHLLSCIQWTLLHHIELVKRHAHEAKLVVSPSNATAPFTVQRVYISPLSTETMLSSTYCIPQICLKRVTSADNLAESSTHSDSTDEVIEIKGDQFEDKKAEAESLQLSSVDMWALGLTTAIAGHYFSWNAGLGAGFGSYLIAMVVISTAYLCLILCISELSSALPFAGQ